MNYFWCNVLDYLKDRRFGSVFFATLLALSGVAAIIFVLFQLVVAAGLQEYLVYAPPLFGLACFVWLGRSIARARARRRDRYKSSPLSRDDLNKARSKLLRTRR